MQTVIIVIHLMVVVALVAVVLLQRSEGGALGIGGGGGFMTARGSANVLTRTTAILGTIFFAISLTLALMNRGTAGAGRSLLDTPPASSSTLPALPLAPATGAGAPASGPAAPGATAPGATAPAPTAPKVPTN